jgi:hypothetical protein
MYFSSRTATAVLICALSATALSATALPAPALAGSPTTVTVRVEGLSETKLPATQVTTTTEPVVKDGNAKDFCPGTNAVGALQAATGGNWNGKWFGGGLNEQGQFKGLGYAPETILGESHTFGSGAFWDVWYDNREATEGLCQHELQPGEEILLFPCPEVAKECLPLGVEAPSSAGVGEAILLTVKKYSPTGQGSPVSGATVTGAAAPSDANGHATVSFTSAGLFTLHVAAPELARAEVTICVHNGNDGTCSTRSPGASSASPGTGALGKPGVSPYRGPYAVVARATGLLDGRVYSRRSAPRVLTGTVTAHTAVTSVSISLRRRRGHACFAYSGVRALFVSARCGTAPFFRVARGPTFSYLLPSVLARGRYVLDIEATDAAGNRTTLARGTSRIVFYVR